MTEDTDEDERRRRNEMNMFAMMAGGAGENFNSNSIAIQTEDLNVSTELNNAAALFEGDDDDEGPTIQSTKPPILPRQQAVPPSESPNMFAERVLLPRPLFFGSTLPTSITKHADANDNLRNALEFYSHHTVSTYQPNFISREESLRKHRQKRHRPDIISRVRTAPARLSPPSDIPPVFDATLEEPDDSDSFRASLSPQDVGNLSDQEKFSQWALMGSSVDTMGMSGESFRFSATTMQRHGSMMDSDDDSMIEDEQKTKVGASDNLNKAIALLSDDGMPAPELETTQLLLSQVAPDGSRKRPLTNYELTEGCTPLFAADDPPLPQESDLGIHETREEQQRSMEKKRAHEMIDKFVPPNVFGSVSCPNVAKHPDDCRSTRSHKSRRSRSPVKPPKSRKESSASPAKSFTRNHKTRFGWWNIPWDEKDNDEDITSKDDENALQLPPIQHSASGLHIYSPLEPTPEQLRKDNLPLSRMHSATSMIHTLPFLSDRPPSHRHLQIDTQAVAFPPIKEEIEPFFCSMAIYNVETVAGTSSKSPLPDLQRCGRVTEALYFDYHADASTEQRCYNALWPYDGDHIGTRCGIFPIPSNLNVTNLYAVLIIRKVVGSSSDDLDPYLKPGKQWTDVERLKTSAAKASEKNGQLLMPFAFGVAPLLQVFGLENPLTASSRAVQIPLFHYSNSERQIINHIMYMLFPRAVHSGVGGPAPVTNGGTAMLVMRNFGYIGLHTAVNKGSVLARDRLVDFTGSLQLRRRGKEAEANETTVDSESYVVRAPPWRPHYISEPTRNGGRAKAGLVSIEGTDSGSRLYAQELALWPIQMTPSSHMQNSSQSGISSVRCQHENDDIELSFYTSFCNEILCHPRILHNAPNSRLVLKIELREVEWNAALNVYVAHEVSESFSGAGIHNHRRGPPLVKSAFTSCTPERKTHQFIEDFKIKLPLSLDAAGEDRRLSLFFTIYRLKVGQKAMWKTMFSSSSSEEGEVEEIVRNGRTVRLTCGYLPLSVNSGLLEDGVHDVAMCYKSIIPSSEICQTYNLAASSFLLQEVAPLDDLSPSPREESSYQDDFDKEMDTSVATDTTDARSANEDSYSIRSRTRGESLSLSVRIVAHSSLHSQNGLVNKVLSYRRVQTATQNAQNRNFLASLRMGRDYIITNSTNSSPSDSSVGDDSLPQAILGLGNSQLCPTRVTIAHLPRLTLALWRQIILGEGDASLEWANPSTSPPLRHNAFVTLLRLVESASMFMAQCGNVNVENSEKFSCVVLGRILALLFDEQRLSEGIQETFDLEYWHFFLNSQRNENSPSTKKTQLRRKRHVRSTYDLANEIPSRSAQSQISAQTSSAGDLATLPKPSYLEDEWDEVFDTNANANANVLSLQKMPELKLDSKSDFQSFLRAAVAEESDDVVETKEVHSSDQLQEQAQSFSATYSGQGRRFHTLPPNVLTTIPEGDHGDDTTRSFYERRESQSSISNLSLDGLAADVIEMEPQTLPQMRRPKLKKAPKGSSTEGPNSTEDNTRNLVPIQCDDQIESMGTAFLDTIAEDMLRGSLTPSKEGEEPRVGSTHHRRRTNGWSSIDWSLTVDDRVSSPPSAPNEEEIGSESGYDEFNDSMVSLREEEKAAIRMPGFAERLVILGDTNKGSLSGRWFPFAYEVIILQWAKVLSEPDRRKDGRWSSLVDGPLGLAGAPMLFEIVKHSIGFRTKSIFSEVFSKERRRETPPLLILDDTLFSGLSVIVTKVTDACLDHNNFDSLDRLQMSTNVNDAVVIFLRDLYGFLAPSNVYNLIMIYFSRFSTKCRANSVDRESTLGLRCSWELARMRLNAVSVFARFSEFTKVNSPQMLGWEKWWASSPSRSKGVFYDKILCRFEGFRLPQFSGICDQQKEMPIVSMRPHWLAEILVDVCLAGIEHAEHKIQQKSAALLYELMWASSQESILSGIATPVASMYLTIIEKLLPRSTYLSNFSPKSQLRRDIMTCLIYVLQATSPDLLRALWRRLCSKLPGEGGGSAYGFFGVEERSSENQQKEAYSVLDMFSLLNLALRTLEYDGCDEVVDVETTNVTRNSLEVWHRDFLPSKAPASDATRLKMASNATPNPPFTTSASRKWQAHDGSIVIVRVVNQIVRELYNTLSKSANGKSLLNPAIRSNQQRLRKHGADPEAKHRPANIDVSKNDTVLFIRGATSVYLHSLSLQESDVVIEKTFVYTAEVIKIFGVRLFLEAVGETLQHWMRVVSFHCGARRSQVRIASTDLLELILRSTWECFGSFFRIRVPLLAVQTEVMERMVALAAARYFKEQRRLGSNFEPFNNLGAEASLVPLWRTLDRIENNPASQNVAFRGALVRIAGKLKKLYRAYVAARALSFVRPGEKSDLDEQEDTSKYESDSNVRAIRINTLRVLNASEGFTRQFLSMRGTTQTSNRVAHYEAVEDALLDAANVFSPTELPEHRVAWLRMLAQFHSTRQKHAEEAACRYLIHVTLRLAARLHGSLWSNTPFLPWTDDIPDPIVYIDAETSQTGDVDSDAEGSEWEYGSHYGGTNSFRRIFYRVATSVRDHNLVWDTGVNKNLFFGVTFAPEYSSVNPWLSLREMEDSMIEEVETSGALFLKAGIVESSRCAWGLAAEYHTEKFNFEKLAMVYDQLAGAVVSKVSPIDTSLPQEVSTTFGRFYRVWLHGEAPDELRGIEFVYRSTTRLKEFGEEIRSVIKSIMPKMTPVHLVLDGLSEDFAESSGKVVPHSGFRIGPAQLAPVSIKVTPLRPLFSKFSRTRGLPEWFHHYISEQYEDTRPFNHRTNTLAIKSLSSIVKGGDRLDSHHQHSRSFSATVFSSTGSTGVTNGSRKSLANPFLGESDRSPKAISPRRTDLLGVDKFCFVQPIDHFQQKEWWKTGNFVAKCLRVLELQVAEPFPACVGRQKVIQRNRFNQSPLEAAIDALCQWCAVLYRTAVATTGISLMAMSHDPGIGTDASKIVADCIHNSHVKEIASTMLTDSAKLPDIPGDNDCLQEDDIYKLQLKLARLVVTFIELLHILISRNRDELLDVIKDRKKETGGRHQHGSSANGSRVVFNRAQSLGPRDIGSGWPPNGGPPSSDQNSLPQRQRSDGTGLRAEDNRQRVVTGGSEDNHSYHSTMTNPGVRTDSAIAVQSELQRSFINLTKSLHKNIQFVMREDTPSWLAQCCQEYYFSRGTYRSNRMPIVDELCFQSAERNDNGTLHGHDHVHPLHNTSLHSDHGCESPRAGSISGRSHRSHNSNSGVSRTSGRF